MEIEIEFVESRTYRAKIELPDEEVLRWANREQPATDPPVSEDDIGPAELRDFLESGADADFWWRRIPDEDKDQWDGEDRIIRVARVLTDREQGIDVPFGDD